MPTYVSLPNSKRRLLPNSRIAGPVNRSEIDSLTIHVRSKGNFDELESDVNKNSRLPLSKRKYRTRAELRGAFGARDADMNAVETLAQHHNLMVVHRDAAERSIVLKGKLANLLA